jgi:hypothetical protein
MQIPSQTIRLPMKIFQIGFRGFAGLLIPRSEFDPNGHREKPRGWSSKTIPA